MSRNWLVVANAGRWASWCAAGVGLPTGVERLEPEDGPRAGPGARAERLGAAQVDARHGPGGVSGRCWTEARRAAHDGEPGVPGLVLVQLDAGVAAAGGRGPAGCATRRRARGRVARRSPPGPFVVDEHDVADAHGREDAARVGWFARRSPRRPRRRPGRGGVGAARGAARVSRRVRCG